MNTTKETVTLWLCEDCMIMLANGEVGEDVAFEPLSKLANSDVTLGAMIDEHAARCRIRASVGHECDCETIPFSTRDCDGCNSWLAGTRHAATEWIAS